MLLKMVRIHAVCLCLALTSSVALAGPVNYGDQLGVGPGEVDFLQVTEDSATDPLPLYDAPIHLPNQLLFFPLTFTSAAQNGSFDTTQGVLTMGIRADVGYYLDQIILNETGDFTLSGVGTSGTSADVVGLLSVEDIAPGGSGVLNDSVAWDVPAPPYTLPPPDFDEFTGSVTVDLSGLNITEVFLTLDNTLTTTSENATGTASFIQKKVIDLSVNSVLIPEPGTLALMVLSAVCVLRNVRRRD